MPIAELRISNLQSIPEGRTICPNLYPGCFSKNSKTQCRTHIDGLKKASLGQSHILKLEFQECPNNRVI
ncbi:hypothetical protein QQZ08_012136 [Neonectria magnoliae]|uniref:Uncharacterized protein n=1 Tax=Neonectria magnoliae TaxID=2732573 RepID=A0ABR1H4S2_9HYPO